QGGNGLHPALPFVTPAHSFRDLAAPHGFEDATTELLLDMAWRVAERQINGKSSVRSPFRFATQANTANRGDYERAIVYQFGLVLQRDPEPAELRDLVALAEKTQKEASVREALQTVLAAVLINPQAVFRTEVGAGDVDAYGRQMLSA